MEWLKISEDLPEDPVVIFVADRVRLSTDDVVGKLVRLWRWARHQTPDGVLRGITAAYVDRLVGRKGFAQALAEAPSGPWLKIDDGGVTLPEWDVHNSNAAKERALDARRKAAERAQGARPDRGRNGRKRPHSVRSRAGQKPDTVGTRRDEKLQQQEGTLLSPPTSTPSPACSGARPRPAGAGRAPRAAPSESSNAPQACPKCHGPTRLQVQPRAAQFCDKHPEQQVAGWLLRVCARETSRHCSWKSAKPEAFGPRPCSLCVTALIAAARSAS